MAATIPCRRTRPPDPMGVYLRQDSPFYWMLLERPGQKPLCESTAIPRRAYSAEIRKQNRQDAEDVYATRMADLARDRHDLPVHDATTIGFTAYAAWYDTHKIATHRGADREREILAHLIGFFRQQDLAEIDRPRVAEYMTWRSGRKVRGQRIAPPTINREVALLKTMLKVAVPTYLKASPIAGMPLLRTVKKRKRMMAREEEARLLAQLRPADRALYVVAVDTLIRLSNVLNLRRAEYCGTHLALEDSKTGPYEVPLSTRARAALDALPETGEYFFPHRRTAKTARDRRGVIRRLLQRACEKCDPPIPYGRAVTGITFHTATRATGATRMLQAGHDPKTVQTIGNWQSFEQMGEYLQTDFARMQAAVNAVGAPQPEVTTPKRRKPATSHLRKKRRPLKMAKSLGKRRAS